MNAARRTLCINTPTSASARVGYAVTNSIKLSHGGSGNVRLVDWPVVTFGLGTMMTVPNVKITYRRTAC